MIRSSCLLLCLLATLIQTGSDAFCPISLSSNVQTKLGLSRDSIATPSRRSVLANAALLVLATGAPAAGAVMDSSSDETKIFKAGQAVGVDAAKMRFVGARKDLQFLLDNYNDIVKNGGGDNVRRYLGTVGVTSGMYGIMKVLKELQEESSDIVEYTEQMNDFGSALVAADTACYSANFVEFSAATTKPDKFFQDAFEETKRMITAMDGMGAELSLK